MRPPRTTRWTVLALVLGSLGACGREPGPRPNIVLILVDTMRADHLRCYGYRRPTSAAIDQLASRGVRFSEALAQAPYTKASVASLLTARFPSVHGALGLSDPIAHDAIALPQVLQQAGYATGGFYLNTNVHALFGFDRGFDFYVHPGDAYLRQRGIDPSEPKKIAISAIDDRAITEAVVNGLATPPAEPFFLYLHLIGPHDPYVPPPEAPSFTSGELTASAAHFFQDRLSDDDITSNTLAAMRHGFLPVDEQTLEQMIALYDSEIAFSDAQIGRILAAFEQAHLAERTIFIVTADHGEEFREHGDLGHGRTQYRELLHVPLVIAGPGIAHGTVDQPVRLIDVMPTLLDWVALDAPSTADGVSFAPVLRDPSATLESRSLYAEGIMPDQPDPFLLHSYQRGGLKLILDGRRREKLLFDLVRDPAEQHSVLRERASEGEALLELLIAQHGRNRAHALTVAALELTADMDQRMRAIGYGAGPGLDSVAAARRELVPFEIAPLGLIGDEREVAKYVAMLDFGAAFPAEQLLYGWWPKEGVARWMTGQAGVRLKRETGRSEWFVSGYVDLASHAVPSLGIQVSIDGGLPMVCKIAQTGEFTLHGPLPSSSAPLTRIDLTADHVFVPVLQGKTDTRALSISVRSIGLR